MEQKRILNKLPASSPAPSTAAASKASKSGSSKGKKYEELVKHDLEKKGYIILQQRLRTPFAEVDIFAEDLLNQRLAIIEVKSLANPDWASDRLKSSQEQRLQNARNYLGELHSKKCVLLLALVKKESHIIYIHL
jgi:Holliday junction resolvase-like predicted endonuclease